MGTSGGPAHGLFRRTALKVYLINPSPVSFGTAVITPRWQYVLAGATPKSFGDPILVDETLVPLNLESVQQGDIVGIGIHTANALRGYEIGKHARSRGAFVVFGGIHATLFPEEAAELGGAHSVVKGDGDTIWPRVLSDCQVGQPAAVYVGGRIDASDFVPARWELVPRNRYVGIGTDGAWLPETLFFLFGMENRWTTASTACVRCCDRRSCPATTARFPIRCAR
jgi:hypothetical protein